MDGKGQHYEISNPDSLARRERKTLEQGAQCMGQSKAESIERVQQVARSDGL